MVKLPRRPVRADSSAKAGLLDHTPRSDTAVVSSHEGHVSGVPAGGGDKGHSSVRHEAEIGDLPLDLAIESVLAAANVDAVTQVRLEDMRSNLVEVDPRAMIASLYGRNLAHSLLSFVMPQLRHPEVLQAGNHSAILERLASALEGVDETSDQWDGAVAIGQELQRLTLLRQNRNSMIEG